MNAMLLAIVSDSDGAATVNGDRSVIGFLYAIHYTIGTLAVTGDIVVSTQSSVGAQTLLTVSPAADAWYYPRVDSCGATGTALSANAEYPVLDGIPRVVIAQGGSVASGSVELYWFE